MAEYDSFAVHYSFLYIILCCMLESAVHYSVAVLQVGVDLNLAAQTPWQAHPLQFVAGLGPRKATALLKAVQRQEQVAARRAVWKELNVIGKKVFWLVNLPCGCYILTGECVCAPACIMRLLCSVR